MSAPAHSVATPQPAVSRWRRRLGRYIGGLAATLCLAACLFMGGAAVKELFLRSPFHVTLATAPSTAPATTSPVYPSLSGRVVDEAGILGDSRNLVRMLADLESRRGDQLVVATLSSLHGQSIEQYANGLFRDWKLSAKNRNNGVLLVMATNERRVRIEVGYGLEGMLTDARTKMIIERDIIPRFKSGDFAGGARAGAAAIIAVLDKDRSAARSSTPTADAVVSAAANVLPYLPFVVVGGAMLLIIGALLISVLVNIGAGPRLVPAHGHRRGRSTRPNARDDDSNRSRDSSDSSDRSWSLSDSSSSSSSDSDSFSGGGGDSGGGGASGQW